MSMRNDVYKYVICDMMSYAPPALHRQIENCYMQNEICHMLQVVQIHSTAANIVLPFKQIKNKLI